MTFLNKGESVTFTRLFYQLMPRFKLLDHIILEGWEYKLIWLDDHHTQGAIAVKIDDPELLKSFERVYDTIIERHKKAKRKAFWRLNMSVRLEEETAQMWAEMFKSKLPYMILGDAVAEYVVKGTPIKFGDSL